MAHGLGFGEDDGPLLPGGKESAPDAFPYLKPVDSEEGSDTEETSVPSPDVISHPAVNDTEEGLQ